MVMKNGTKLLLVDDNADFLDSYGFLLEDQGYTVETASTGREALKKFKSALFDLVITDIVMPDMEGLETIMELKKIKSDIPVIAISGGGKVGPEQYLRTAQMMGAGRALYKPLSFNTLHQAIRELLPSA